MNKTIQLKDKNGFVYPISEIYSTKEQKIGLWVDGKPLYRKTVIFNPTTGWHNISITDLNVETVFINYGKTFAEFSVDGGNYVNGSFYASDTDCFRAFISNSKTMITTYFPSDFTNRIAYITIEYTKITD